jgi:hypothetical protein
MLQEHLKPTIKIAYHAFLALPEEDKLACLEFIEHQMESERLYELMQEGDQTLLTETEQSAFLQKSTVFSNDPVLIQKELRY